MRGLIIFLVLLLSVPLTIADYGYSPDQNRFFFSRNFSFEHTPIGAIRIWEGESLKGAVGFGVSGQVNGQSYFALSSDFTPWAWWNETRQYSPYEGIYPLDELRDEDYYDYTVIVGTNANPTFTWFQEWHFYNELTPVKLVNRFVNNFGRINNFRFWYIHTLTEGDVLEYDGLQYVVMTNETDYLTGDFTNILPQTTINDAYFFEYFDLVREHTITNIIIGGGEFFGAPNIPVIAIGVKPPNDVFLQGQVLVFDPSVMHSDFEEWRVWRHSTISEWFNLNLTKDSDNLTANVGPDTISSTDFARWRDFGFRLPSHANVTGLTVRSEGKAYCAGCNKRSGAFLIYNISTDGGVSNGEGVRTGAISSGGYFIQSADQIIYLGNASYTWGYPNLNGSGLADHNFELRAHHVGGNFFGIASASIDQVTVNVSYEAFNNTAPNISLQSPINGSFVYNNMSWINFTIQDNETGSVTDLMNYRIWLGHNSTHMTTLLNYTYDVYNGTHAVSINQSPIVPYFEHDLYALYHMDWERKHSKPYDVLYDYGPRGLNGTMVEPDGEYHSLQRSPGVFNYGLNLTDTDTYVQIGNGTDFRSVCDNGCTFSAWVNPDVTGASNAVISRWHITGNDAFFYLYISGTNTPIFYVTRQGAVTAGNYCLAYNTTSDMRDRWTHLVGTWNTTHCGLYIDGEGIMTPNNGGGSFTPDPAAWDDFEPTYLGVTSTALSSDFRGAMDEVAIWNTSKTQAEILNMFNLRKGTYWMNVSVDDNLNDTSWVSNFTVASDPCEYSGTGSWNTPCACKITENIDVGNNNISIHNDFTNTSFTNFSISANITGVDFIEKTPECLVEWELNTVFEGLP